MKNFPPIPFFASALGLVAIGVMTTVNLSCPVCGGNGYLAAAQGLTPVENSIKLLKQVPVYTFGECGMPLRMVKYTYSVDMTLTNSGKSDTKGTVKVVFARQGVGTQWVQDQEGNMVEQQYRPPTVPAYVDVPAGATRDIHVTLTFVDAPIIPGEPALQAKITSGEDTRDPTCDGTGSLSFVKWLGAKVRPPSFQ